MAITSYDSSQVTLLIGGVLIGGFGSAILEFLEEENLLEGAPLVENGEFKPVEVERIGNAPNTV